MPAGRVARECKEFAAFADREPGITGRVTDARTGDDSNDRVPMRLKRGPLDSLDHLNAGWDALDAQDRERWRALKERWADPRAELAWFAADGSRDYGAIARLVALETHECAVTDVDEFFSLTARLGLSAWRGKPS